MHAQPAHAKLNLGLRVLAREQSGFHQIETVFCSLDLADDVEVEIVPSGIALDVQWDDGAVQDLGPIEQNLAWRAAELFTDVAGTDGGIAVRLVKRIPAGAGLGGGSSDAAAVLIASNELHARPLSNAELLGLGARLGSDVPFFVSGATLARAWGRGDRIMPLQPLPPATVLLAMPPERVSTADAYAAFDAVVAAPAIVEVPRAWTDVARSAQNDFERIVFTRHPRLGRLLELIESGGAIVARMTGTGSVVFGVFEDAVVAASAADRVAAEFDDVRVVLTRTRG